jgi:hypothetical protein
MEAPSAPGRDEYAPFYAGYVARVGPRNPLTLLETQPAELARLVGSGEDRARLAPYGPGKWSVKGVLVHLSDAERVMSTRALRFGRGDTTPVPGFDEQAYALASRADRRSLEEILEEFHAARASTLALFRGLEPEALDRRGTANEASVSVRGLLWIIPGHVEHHMEILRERYGLE